MTSRRSLKLGINPPRKKKHVIEEVRKGTAQTKVDGDLNWGGETESLAVILDLTTMGGRKKGL